MSELVGNIPQSLPDAGQGTGQHPAGQGTREHPAEQIFPGEVGVVSKPDFLGPRFDPGPFWARVAEKAGAFLGSAAGAMLGYFLDWVDEAIAEEEREKEKRELLEQAKMARVEELWEVVHSLEVVMPVRLEALFEIGKIKLDSKVRGWFGKLDSEKLTFKGDTLEGECGFYVSGETGGVGSLSRTNTKPFRRIRAPSGRGGGVKVQMTCA